MGDDGAGVEFSVGGGWGWVALVGVSEEGVISWGLVVWLWFLFFSLGFVGLSLAIRGFFPLPRFSLWLFVA
jgi:hypothetical protein